MLNTALTKLCFLIVKAREFDAKVAPVEEQPGGNPIDEQEAEILEDFADDATEQELRAALDLLDDDERIEVLALTWLGRGDFDRKEWKAALAQAAAIHNSRETDYLMGIPQFGDFLEEGLAQLGYDCNEVESGRL